MKRFCGSFCILLIAFNSIEYYGLILLAQKQLTKQILQKIEANSHELGGNLILVIPIELPYSSDSEEYTRINGEFVHDGQVYRMVKQKFYRDKLYVVCIKENEDAQVATAIADYSRLFSGSQAERANSNIKIVNSLSKDYISKLQFPKSKSGGWSRSFNPKQFTDLYRFNSVNSIFHPPQNS